MDHEASVRGDFYTAAATGDNGSCAGGQAVDINSDISPRGTQSVENGQCGIYFASDAVDTHIDSAAFMFGCHQLLDDVFRLHASPIPDITIEHNAATIRTVDDVHDLMFHDALILTQN